MNQRDNMRQGLTEKLVFVKTALDKIFSHRRKKTSVIKTTAVVLIAVALLPLYVIITVHDTRLFLHLPSNLLILRPYFTTILTLFLIYKYLPDHSPDGWTALIGSLFAGVLLEGEKLLLAMYFSYMNSVYRIIYGALFLLPLFLVWLYISWCIILTGATLSFIIEKRLKR